MRKLVGTVILLLASLAGAPADGAAENDHAAFSGTYIVSDFCSVTIKAEHATIIFSVDNPSHWDAITKKFQYFRQFVIVERLADGQIQSTMRRTIVLIDNQEYHRTRAEADFDLFKKGCLEEAKVRLSVQVKRLIGEYFGNAYGLYDGFPKANTVP